MDHGFDQPQRDARVTSDHQLRDDSALRQGNQALRAGDARRALSCYQQALIERPALAPMIRANLRLARRRLARQGQEAPVSTGLDKLYHALPAHSQFADRLRTLQLETLPPGLRDAITAAEHAVAAHLTDAPACWHAVGETRAPLVSIIMPTHNRAALIAEAIASVLEQRYASWELWVCDDGSTDHTAAVVARVADARVHYLPLPKQGAAAARNQGIQRARGALIAYLDTDNLWHPDYLAIAVALLQAHPGHSALYMDYLDCRLLDSRRAVLERFGGRVFDPEALLQQNFIDLNAFVHRRELAACFGGFDTSLARLQDYALILKYSWLRDPLYWPHPLNLYLRDPHLLTITAQHGQDPAPENQVRAQIQQLLHQGLPRQRQPPLQALHILSWDSGRNHFAKPFALAEALCGEHQVRLLSFDFFQEGVFEPLRTAALPCPLWLRPGGAFPGFFAQLDAALEALDEAELLYVVKPRLPSLGLALLANRRTGVPLLLEVNDLETVVNRVGAQAGPQPVRHAPLALEAMDSADPELLNPYSERWAQLLDPLAQALPVVLTHNRALDAHFGHRCLYMRNIKDERVYAPERYERAAIRADLGYGGQDRVILFGGLLREHKGVYQLLRLLDELNDTRYKLLFIASRPSPEQAHLAQLARAPGARVRLLPTQDRTGMARMNLAADVVILWLDPAVPASHYQMPYKATDALAMGTPIIANPISDLEVLGQQGYLRLVSYGDLAALRAAVDALFANPQACRRQVMAGQRLFRRQFSYAAARANFDLARYRLAGMITSDVNAPKAVLPAAERFGAAFDRFRARF